MKRILLHLAISALAFGLGVAASTLWQFYTAVNVPEPVLAEIPARESQLKLLTIGCGSDITTYSYGLANGREISRTCQHFSSAAEANRVLQARRGEDSNVIESSEILNHNGQLMGKTVLIMVGPTVVRLSTNRETLCETRAFSMDEMRWFDNRESR